MKWRMRNRSDPYRVGPDWPFWLGMLLAIALGGLLIYVTWVRGMSCLIVGKVPVCFKLPR